MYNETTARMRHALLHVADEITGQLHSGTLKDAEFSTRVYWAQVAGVARTAYAESMKADAPPESTEAEPATQSKVIDLLAALKASLGPEGLARLSKETT